MALNYSNHNITTSGLITANSGNFITNLAVNSNAVWHSGNFDTSNIVRAAGNQTMSGDLTIGGNLTVNGTTITANVDTMTIEDPIITLGLTSGNIVTNDTLDRGLALIRATGLTAFMGWDTSSSQFIMLSSGVATNSSGNYDAGTYGNLRINDLISNNGTFNGSLQVGGPVRFTIGAGGFGVQIDRGNIDPGFGGDVLKLDVNNDEGVGYSTTLMSNAPGNDIIIKLPADGGTLARLSDINASQITGVLSVDKGGTNRSTYNNGQLLIGSGTSLVANTLSAGTGISITNGSGTITINTSGLQTILMNPVTGTGVASHIAYWNSSSGITADSGQLYWDSTNNRLGIGTATPSEALDVAGNININGYTRHTFSASDYSNSVIAPIIWYNIYNNINTDIAKIDVSTDSGPAEGMLVFHTNDGSSLQERLRITDVGDVGIGTASPSSRLEVAASATTSVDIAHFSNSSGVEKAKFSLSSNGDGTLSLIDGNNVTNAFLSSSSTSNSYVNGKFGIGTSTPSGQLHVIGSGIFSSGLFVASTPVSVSGHSHTSSNITNFNSSVSGLINGIYAPLNSPALIGVPTVPTASSGTNTTQIASTAFVRTEISNLVASAPSALDTLNELAASLGNDANFSTTVTNNLAGKANLSGATFTGSISGPSGNFVSLKSNGTDVSVVGHTHASSNITDFSSSVSGLLPTISNSGDNRILTSTGSTVGVTAESNLTFDGNLLNVTGSGVFASGLNLSNQTANTIASFDSSKNLTSLSTATYPSLTELSYLKGTTSSLQTQINSKQNTLTNPVTGTGVSNHIAYWNSSSGIVSNSGQLVWDPANNRLGIGTITPTSKLHVAGDILATGSFIAGSGSASNPSFEFVGDTDTGLFSPAANTIALATSGVERFRIDNNGSISMNGPLNMDPNAAGTINCMYVNAGPSIGGQIYTDNLFLNQSINNITGGFGSISFLDSNANTSFLLDAENGLTLYDYSANTLFYTDRASSRIGIGTAAPSETLDITGNVNIDGDLKFDSFTESVVANGNSGTSKTLSLASGTVHTCTLTGNCTFTMPTSTAGKSFTIFLNSGSGNYTASFSGVIWADSTTPTATITASKVDIYSFISDGTYWYGSFSQNYG